jgi:hypothetical protein
MSILHIKANQVMSPLSHFDNVLGALLLRCLVDKFQGVQCVHQVDKIIDRVVFCVELILVNQYWDGVSFW